MSSSLLKSVKYLIARIDSGYGIIYGSGSCIHYTGILTQTNTEIDFWAVSDVI